MGERPLRVQPDDPGYLHDLAAEAAFWDKPQYFDTEACGAFPLEAPFTSYDNRRLTDDPTTRWFETIHRYGDFRRALFIGVSGVPQEARVLELSPNMHVTFADISEGLLERRAVELGQAFPGRVATQVTDLNFVELTANAFDVIISAATLHHVQNIEHVAQQINRALAPGGYFFVQDYVAETQFQFRPEKRRIFDAFIERGKSRGDVPQSWRVDWPDLDAWIYSPFEAIRSEDTLSTLSRYLDQLFAKGAGALTLLLFFMKLDAEDEARFDSIGAHCQRRRPHSSLRRLRASLGRDRAPAMSAAFQRDLFLLDSIMCDSGTLLPANVFAGFRKRA